LLESPSTGIKVSDRCLTYVSVINTATNALATTASGVTALPEGLAINP
jgi:hypothetical protein